MYVHWTLPTASNLMGAYVGWGDQATGYYEKAVIRLIATMSMAVGRRSQP
jgi:hypothetical protein